MHKRPTPSRSIRAGLPAILAAIGMAVSAREAASQVADTIVRQASAPRHTRIGTLVPELSIGMVNGPIEYAFVRVTDVATGPDGSVFVLDVPFGATPFLRQYDAAGRYMRTIGRLGRGPGEYTGPAGITVLSDGRILLLDGLGARINVYAPAGDVIDTWQMREYRSDFVTGTGGALLRRGPGDVVTILARVRRPRPILTPEGASRIVMIRLRPDGTLLDTIPAPVLPDVAGSSVAKANRRPDGTIASSSTHTVPYAPRAMWEWSPLGYAVTGVSSRYAFELRVPAAPGVWSELDPVISIRRAHTPIPVGREERAARVERLRAGLDRGTGSVEGPIPPVPERKPPYTSIAVGDDGRIWVRVSTPSERYEPPEPAANPTMGMSGGSRGGAPAATSSSRPLRIVPWREPTRYDVFEPDGTYIGQVDVPYDTRIVRMRGDTVWAVVSDENDVQIVRRHRVVW